MLGAVVTSDPFGGDSDAQWPVPRAFPFAILLALTATLGVGCTLNFDNFEARGESGDGATVEDAGDGSAGDSVVDPGDGTHSTDGDGGTIQPDGDAGPVGFEIGAKCQGNGDCGDEGKCVRGYCTISCKNDDACGSNSVCEVFSGKKRCLLRCRRDATCASPGGRSDLNCATVRTTPVIGRRASRGWACVPDADADGVFDGIDSCPMKANAAQRDRDADGTGDACDMTPRCHDSAKKGRVSFGSQTFAGTDFAAPPTATRSWIPVAGGTSKKKPFGKFARLDVEKVKWTGTASMPYPAADQAIAGIADVDAYVATTGKTNSDQAQIGRLVFFSTDREVRVDGGFDPDLEDPVAATTGYGRLVVLGFDTSGSTPVRRMFRYRPGNDSFKQLRATSVSTRRTWHVVTTARGHALFYSEPTGAGQAPNRMRIIEVGPGGSPVGEKTMSLPSLMTGSMMMQSKTFEPFVVPGAGNSQLYAFDRKTGQAATLDMVNDKAARQPKLDLQLPFPVTRVSTNPHAPSFILFGRKKGSVAKVTAEGFFAKCHSGLSGLDSDGDKTPDISDNCPTVANMTQLDVDFDDIGDACDTDADNDGVENGKDNTTDQTGMKVSRAQDTDNDGQKNKNDPDIDGDGIPNAKDPFPVDTDNNGVPNHLDGDDDNDGYGDSSEAANGTKPLDPLSFPNAGYVSFVRRSTGGSKNRSVHVGPLPDLGSATKIIKRSFDPHLPHFFDGKDGLVALSGSPGTSKKIVWWKKMSAPAEVELGAPLRAVVPMEADKSGNLTSVSVVRNQTMMKNQWVVTKFDLAMKMPTDLVTSFNDVTSLDRDGSTFAFLAGPRNCPACRSVFAASTSGGRPSLVAAPDDIPKRVRRAGGRFGVVATSTKTKKRHAYVVHGNNTSEVEPPGVVDIDSVVPLDFHGHLLVSGKTNNSSYDIWFFNGRKSRWHRIMKSADDLIEIDWIR